MRVLILGTCKQPHRWLMRAGHEAVLVITKDKVTPEDLHAGYRQLIVVDSRSSDLVGLAEHLHRVEKFDAVCAYSDVWQPLANRVADTLGLQRPVSSRALELTMNKSKMRTHLAEAGVEEVGHRLVKSREQIAEALRELGAPCILKPIAGEASNGVARIDGDDDIDRAITHFRGGGNAFPAITEKFLVGDEYSVEAISEAGRHWIISITEKYKDEVTFVEKGHVVPAPLAGDVAQAIRDHVVRVLDAIGLTRGPSHSEVVLTELGPRMIETHTRVGGDRIPELVRIATGIDLYELCARQSLGESIAQRLPATVTYQGAAAIWYACPAASPDMVLSRIDEDHAVRALPGIDLVEVSKQVGDRGGPVRSSLDRTGLVVARGNDAAEARARARAGVEQMQFHYRWHPASAAEDT